MPYGDNPYGPIFPVLPGLGFEVVKAPTWTNVHKEALSGKRTSVGFMDSPIWEYTLTYELLREYNGLTELQTLCGFFNARNGSLIPFYYWDPRDNAVTAYQFGTGDGSTKDFQLKRAYGGFVEPVQSPLAVTQIKKAGVTQTETTHYSVGDTGIITFVNAPANGAALTWTGTYYWCVQFMQDASEFTEFMKNLYSLKKLQFRTWKL